jgi:type I restriction enzyme R subunit
LLYIQPDHPIAVVEAKADHKDAVDGLQQAMEYAQMIDLSFAYASNGKEIIEHDFLSGKERAIMNFPQPEDLLQRLDCLNLSEKQEEVYYQACNVQDGRIPRYYQIVAINRALKAILSGKERVLICMATGTGKTLVAFQILWKLWKMRWNISEEHRRPKALYLADRNVLIDSPKDKTFAPFGDARWKIRGHANKSREMYFSTYQAIAEDERRPGLYKDYPPDFFDLIVVDECHRGSARDESNWRQILEYFSPATQIGMTATPRREDNRDTYLYFGDPVYTYSLADGIRDGFLAPFEVYRVVADVDAFGWRPEKEEVDKYGREIPDREYTTPDFGKVISHLPRTKAYAKRLTDFMREHNRYAKTIVFCEDSEEAAIMRQELVNLNSDLVKTLPNYVVRIVSKEGDVGYGELDKFMDIDSDAPVIVTTSKLLSTGVDVQTCKNIVIFKTINSIVEFKQIIGRGTRVREDYGKLYFNILDFTGSAVTNFSDPEFDGDPARLTREEIDEHGVRTQEAIEKDWDTVPSVDEEDEIIVEGPGEVIERRKRKRKKFYVEDGKSEVVGETVYTLDSHGKRISAIKYTEYVEKQIRTLYSSKDELRSKWSDWSQREGVLKLMEENGIDLDHLQEILERADTDPFDLLCNMAFNAPVLSRRDRLEKLEPNVLEFFEKYQEPARVVLRTLLDIYSEAGVGEISTMEVFKLPRLRRYGNIIEIQALFGGKSELLDAINNLQELIYSEVE